MRLERSQHTKWQGAYVHCERSMRSNQQAAPCLGKNQHRLRFAFAFVSSFVLNVCMFSVNFSRASFMTKTVQYQNELHKFLIWDTAGQERVSILSFISVGPYLCFTVIKQTWLCAVTAMCTVKKKKVYTLFCIPSFTLKKLKSKMLI